MSRNVDNFFNQTQVTYRPPSPETEVARCQRIRAETVVQEVRLRNFDDVLMDLRELFNQNGIVRNWDILAELVMGQYDLAKRNNNSLLLLAVRSQKDGRPMPSGKLGWYPPLQMEPGEAPDLWTQKDQAIFNRTVHTRNGEG